MRLGCWGRPSYPPPLSKDRPCLTNDPPSDRTFWSDPWSDRDFGSLTRGGGTLFVQTNTLALIFTFSPLPLYFVGLLRLSRILRAKRGPTSAPNPLHGPFCFSRRPTANRSLRRALFVEQSSTGCSAGRQQTGWIKCRHCTPPINHLPCDWPIGSACLLS